MALAFPRRAVLHPVCAGAGPHRLDLPVQAADRRVCRPRRGFPAGHRHGAPRAKRRLPPPSPRCPAQSCSSTKSRASPMTRCGCISIRPTAPGRIVYVHPESLAILKTVAHTHRLTEIVRTIHSELLAGRTGAILIELAASWAIVMLVTGVYLWWPRESRGAAGVLYPRLRAGTSRVLARPARRLRHLGLGIRDVPVDHRAAVDHGLGRGSQRSARIREPAGQTGLEPEPCRRTRGAPARSGRRRGRHAAHARSRSSRASRRSSSSRRCASIYRTSACLSGAYAPRRRTVRWCVSSSSTRTPARC